MLFYTSCVRSVTEYAIPTFYNALPLYLKNELLRIEKRSISIITAGDCAVAQDLGITTYFRALRISMSEAF